MRGKAQRSLRLVWAGALLVAMSTVLADAWLDAGDVALRHDLQFLVDSGVVRLPLTTWPIPSSDVAQALERIGNRDGLSVGEQAVLRRLEQRLARWQQDAVRTAVQVSGAAEPVLIRSFANTPRDEGEISTTLSAANERFSVRLNPALVLDPVDDKSWRLDGSYLSARVGNWLLTAGALDRWWGPGWDGSLILSNNARPVPALSLDRESSVAPQQRWLRWVGPWRLSTFVGQMEEERQDIEGPLLFGTRFTFQPLPFAELSVVRSAQFCGEGRQCNADTFWNLLTGEDNVGPGETLDPEDEPGNQLAGLDLRVRSPWKGVPLAIYRQTIGEDLNDKGRPSGRMVQWGLEGWHAFANGGTLRAHLEYADTTCSATGKEKEFDCAYSHHIYNVEGYRYRGRTIGHAADNDSRLYSLGVNWAMPSQWNMALVLRRGRLNRGGNIPDARNTVAQEPSDLRNIEWHVQRPFLNGALQLGVGFDEFTTRATGDTENTVRGFLAWQYRFD